MARRHGESKLNGELEGQRKEEEEIGKRNTEEVDDCPIGMQDIQVGKR